MNVAAHLNRLGVSTAVISCVGEDELGQELLTFLQKQGIPTQLIQQHKKHATGQVQVNTDDPLNVTYTIDEPSAWDYIESNAGIRQAVKKSSALVFGSLAARNPISRETLLELLAMDVYRIFDVNLRAPFYDHPLLTKLLKRSDLVKVNETELEIIGEWYQAPASEPERLRFLADLFELEGLILTKGAQGSVMLLEGNLHEQEAFHVEVEDTIGSGDAYLAALISRLIEEEAPEESLRYASALGALVATKAGPIPSYGREDINSILFE